MIYESRIQCDVQVLSWTNSLHGPTTEEGSGRPQFDSFRISSRDKVVLYPISCAAKLGVNFAKQIRYFPITLVLYLNFLHRTRIQTQGY